MGEFFRGWKRKTGCITLLMALLAMVGWVRSQFFEDTLVFPSGKFTADTIVSGERLVGWFRFHETDSQNVPKFPEWYFDKPSDNRLIDDPEINWFWRGCGFGSGEFQCPSYRTTCWIVPYYSIVIPLTFISALLLLTKTHKSTPMKIIEPTAIDGA